MLADAEKIIEVTAGRRVAANASTNLAEIVAESAEATDAMMTVQMTVMLMHVTTRRGRRVMGVGEVIVALAEASGVRG